MVSQLQAEGKRTKTVYVTWPEISSTTRKVSIPHIARLCKRKQHLKELLLLQQVTELGVEVGLTMPATLLPCPIPGSPLYLPGLALLSS